MQRLGLLLMLLMITSRFALAFDKSRYYEGTPNPRIEKLRQGKYQVVK